MPTLTYTLYRHLNLYPAHYFEAHQWREEGWVYALDSDRYVHYTIDRKDQHDSVHASLTRDEFIARVMPSAPEGLQLWFDGLSVLREGDMVWVASNGTLWRFGALPTDSDGPSKRTRTTIQPSEAPQAVREWLGADKP